MEGKGGPIVSRHPVSNPMYKQKGTSNLDTTRLNTVIVTRGKRRNLKPTHSFYLDLKYISIQEFS